MIYTRNTGVGGHNVVFADRSKSSVAAELFIS